MFKRFTLAIIVAVSIVNAAPSQAEVTPVRHFLMSCKATPNIECIKSITAISETGMKSTATAPIRSVEVTGGLNPIDVREEWAFDGFKFEGTAGNRAVPGIVYRPKGSEDCDAARCITGIEELQVGMQASWLNATLDEWKKLEVDLSRRGNQYLCGTVAQPTICHRNHNFNTQVTFEIVVRMPLEFEPAALLGSVKNLSFSKSSSVETIDGVSYRDLVMRFDPQVLQRPLFSNLIPNPLGTSDYADFESDASNFWIVGSKSIQATGLGKCSTVPFITVLSNSTYQDLPVWNPFTQSIDVTLTASHFRADGNPHIGYFEATISKAMGRCLWGIDLSTKSEAKMSISYSGAAGPEVQTVTGRFDGDNYILFSANFHYSSPKVSLTLQDSSPVVAPTQAPVPLFKNIAITCYKGKLKKVVKGSNPVCPTGYKKK
jgi:hypothetical protein